MSGIAYEKGVPGSEALCDGGGERESPVIKNAYGQIWNPRSRSNSPDQLIFGDLGHAFRSRIPAETVDPPVALPGGQKRAGSGRSVT